MNQRIVFRITFAGIMLSLVLVFQYLEQFMPFAGLGFVNFNLSLVFVLATARVSGFWFALAHLLIRFAFGPLLGSSGGYGPLQIVGQIILLTAGFLVLVNYMAWIWVLEKAVKKFDWKGVWAKQATLQVLASILTVFVVSIVMATLNALWFFPWYLGIINSGYRWATAIPYREVVADYNATYSQFFLFIPNYWAGAYAIYLLFNFSNLTINFFASYFIQKIVYALRPQAESY